jgi:hypothetical protein
MLLFVFDSDGDTDPDTDAWGKGDRIPEPQRRVGARGRLLETGIWEL